MSYVTRVAPSPTGMFHLGTARTAYHSWLAAKASGGKFILRIDDTDANRHDEAAVKVIFDALDWLGLDYDVTFRQSDRSAIYADITADLLSKGLAKRIDGDAVALNVDPAMLPVSFYDDAKRGDIRISDHDRDLIAKLVLVRSDGSPTYHFASCVDDALSGVNYVIRGHDHLTNAPKHIAIWTALGAPIPKMAHVGLIHVLNADGKRVKLSKRDAAASLLNFRDDGVNPDALLNFLLRLGWSASDANFDKHHPLVSKDEAVGFFLDAGRLRDSPVLFDAAKLNSLDKKYKGRIENAARLG